MSSPNTNTPPQPPSSARDELRYKFELLLQLDELKRRGYPGLVGHSFDSSCEVLLGELRVAQHRRARHRMIKDIKKKARNMKPSIFGIMFACKLFLTRRIRDTEFEEICEYVLHRDLK